MKEPKPRNCSWGYSCEMKWDDLEPTGDKFRRFCGDCQEEVYWSHDAEELANNVMLNRCVCFSADLLKAGLRSSVDEQGAGYSSGYVGELAVDSVINLTGTNFKSPDK